MMVGLQLKRQHSVEPESAGASGASRKSPSAGPLGGELTPPEIKGAQPIPGASTTLFGKSFPDDAIVGSPLKKHRPSVTEGADGDQGTRASSFPPALGDVLAKAEAAQQQQQKQTTPTVKEEDEDEEL